MSLLFKVALVHFFACMSPGPDSLLVLRNAARFGPGRGFATLGGILVGVTLMICAGLSGITALLERWPALAGFLQLAGALYVGWLGLQSLRSRPVEAGVDEVPYGRTGGWSAFRQGLITNLANSKAWLYFFGLFSLVLTPDQSLSLKLLAIPVMILVQAAGFSGIVLAGTMLHRRGVFKWQLFCERLAGLLFLAFAIVMLLHLLHPLGTSLINT